MLPTRLTSFLKSAGLAQTRCAYCLSPFTPEDPARNPFRGPAPLCPACAPLFALSAFPRCQHCALPTGTEAALCGECLSTPPPWKSIAAYGLYQGALRNAILRLKFGGEIPLASLIGACLDKITTALPPPDALTPIPQHPRHLRRRGFNQAHEIAKALHRCSGLPLRAGLLRRTAPHTPQTGLASTERRRETRHFFEATTQARGLRIWLVDDVMTTGVTMRAAAQALLAGGALETAVIIAARTPRMSSHVQQ